MSSPPDPIRDDFRNFAFLVWRHLNLPPPTEVQYNLTEYLQHGPRRRVIQAFRGVGKSWLTVAFVLWVLYRDPQKKVLVISASKNLADNFSTFCFQLINSMPMLSHLRPSPSQRNAKIQFDVGPARESKDPSVRSVGITGQITGGRADLIVADDIESLNNALTQGARDKLAEAIKEFDSVLKPGGEIVYLGTPQTELSIYNQLPSRGYDIRIWPARYPDAAWMKRNGARLAPMLAERLLADESLVGRPTDPKRFSDLDLAEREASYGRSGFALQFQLDTSLSDQDRYPLKLSDLIVMDCNDELAPEMLVWSTDPKLAWDDSVPCVGLSGDRYYRPLQVSTDKVHWVPYQGAVLAIDPAGRGADELGYCVAKMLNGYVFITACGGLRGGYNEQNLEWLANLAKRQGVNHVVYESNFGDGMFGELFKPVLTRIHPCVVEEVRHSRQKELRIIDTLEPVMNRHRLVIDPKVIRSDYQSIQGLSGDSANSYLLFYQMSRLTKERGCLRHDDRLDALAIAVGYWTQAMAQDEQKRMSSRRDQLLMEELRGFKKHVFNIKASPKRGWFRGSAR